MTVAVAVLLLVTESDGLPPIVLFASGVPCASATVTVKLSALEPVAMVQLVMGDPLHADPLWKSTIGPGFASSVIEKLLAAPCTTVNVLCCWESRFPVAFGAANALTSTSSLPMGSPSTPVHV